MKAYKKLTTLLIFVFLVVLAGSYVRSTGSGLGCPDWPKCFGKLIPPTSVEQLPANYQELYQVNGRSIAPFSVFKTYVEYLNRLLGVLLGLYAIYYLLWSLKNRSKKTHRSLMAFLILVSISLQGVIGKLVVSRHLEVNTISIHLIMTLFIIALILYARQKEAPKNNLNFSKEEKTFFYLLTLLTFIQIFLGLKVREVTDGLLLLEESIPRSMWGLKMPLSFSIHRLVAFILLFFQFLFSLKIRHPETLKLTLLLMAEILLGFLIVISSFSSLIMPIHLLLMVIYLSKLLEIHLAIKK